MTHSAGTRCFVLYAFDIARSISLSKAESLLGVASAGRRFLRSPRTPSYFEYEPEPLRFTESAEPISVFDIHTRPEVHVVLYDFGAALVVYELRVSNDLDYLAELSELLYENEPLRADAESRIRRMYSQLQPALKLPEIAKQIEDYVIFEIEGAAPVQQRELAAILRAERMPLSNNEIEDALAIQLSYSDADLSIIDWNAAILFGPESIDVRMVLEFAIIELLEMRVLDAKLDSALEEAERALVQRGGRRAGLRRLGQLQVDNATSYEAVHNVLKLIGDQFLSKVYSHASKRFHLAEWDTIAQRKLETLESIYSKLSDRDATRRMEILEWIIIILIAISIILGLK